MNPTARKVTQIKRKLIIQLPLSRKAMMVPVSTQQILPLSKEIVGKGYLWNPRKLTHRSKDNEASHFQRKNTASGSCLTSLLNMQTIVYKIFSHEKTSRTVYSIKTMSQPIFISQKSLTKVIKNFWKSIVPEEN